MRTSESVAAISPALVKALSSIKGASKDAANSHFKSNYATLGSVIDASRDILSEHGLVAIQGLGELTDGALCATTRLIHESGEWIESTFHMPLAKRDPQGAGSAATYARRYGLMAMLGMPALDDDGEAAMDRGQQQERQAPTPSGLGADWWKADGAGPSAYQAKKDGKGAVFEEILAEIRKLTSAKDWRELLNANHETILAMPRSWRIELRQAADEMADELGVDKNGKH